MFDDAAVRECDRDSAKPVHRKLLAMPNSWWTEVWERYADLATSTILLLPSEPEPTNLVKHDSKSPQSVGVGQ